MADKAYNDDEIVISRHGRITQELSFGIQSSSKIRKRCSLN